MILCLETATPVCSVAICDNKGVICLKESGEGKSHASLLTPFIDTVLSEAGIKAEKLEAIAVSKGPGSYTGLRIGVSTAKGIAYAASLPLIAVETTFSMFHGFIGKAQERYGVSAGDLFCPILDARRMEVYYTVLDPEGRTIKGISAEVIHKNSFIGFPASSRIFFFGDGALKCKNVIERTNSVFADDFKISAAYMLNPAYAALESKQFEDVAYFEPFYLKDFIATKNVKNILGK
ncbi:MAG: tRNA (adenosine(37)-N6)-threonylcarbamoyltransferase complex dimerization subunit type 1 TsaB [Bacteroidales bacterium]|nr:tRNA (adenosine(37)-N6)-threonylcarbamoyltransferase complex dimerization subunit type 1 TsaB [Bacteroidales bacterium]